MNLSRSTLTRFAAGFAILTLALTASEPGYEVLDLLTAATPSESRDKQR
jgi:hypothetical protein